MKKIQEFVNYNIELLKENEGRINELVELTKPEYATMDNYLIWMCAVGCVLLII